MKMLMQDSKGDLVICGAKLDGDRFRTLTISGYKFIGFIWGLNAGVSGLDVITADKQKIIDKQNAIIKFDQENL
jgi:hypothetical protein